MQQTRRTAARGTLPHCREDKRTPFKEKRHLRKEPRTSEGSVTISLEDKLLGGPPDAPGTPKQDRRAERQLCGRRAPARTSSPRGRGAPQRKLITRAERREGKGKKNTQTACVLCRECLKRHVRCTLSARTGVHPRAPARRRGPTWRTIARTGAEER